MTAQKQQDQDCSTGSSDPKGRRGPTRPHRDDRGCFRSPTLGLDTLLLTRKLKAIDINPQGVWDAVERRHSITFMRQRWAFLDRSAEGWKVWWQPDDQVLEIRLCAPVVMDRTSVTNYPLRDFSLEQLDRLGWSIARVLGIRTRPANPPLQWTDFGVRSAAVTMDLDVADPAGVVGVMHGLHHAGVWAGYRTTCRWKSGTREVQIYAKGAELRNKLSKAEYATLERRLGPLEPVLRFEVTLGVADLKALFGLKDTVWLPKVEVVNTHAVLAWVIYDELFNKLRIRRIFRRRSNAVDRALALADDLVAEARQQGEQPNMATVTKLVGASLLLGGVRSTKELCDRYGFARASANKLRQRLIGRGFPPGVAVEPDSHRLIAPLIQAARVVLRGETPRKPVIDGSNRERLSITAPWVLDHDITRSVAGMSIDDGTIDPEILEAIKYL